VIEINSGLHILELELTNRCNLNCKHCYVDKREAKELSYRIVKSIIKQAGDHGVYRLVFTGGEPLLYLNLFSAAKYAKKNGIENLFLLTNGILINESNVKKLKIFDGIQLSLDNVPGHEYLRENYSNTLERTILLLQKNNIKINLYCTLCKSNVNSVDKIVKYAKSINVRIGFNTLIILDKKQENQRLSVSETKAALTKITKYIDLGYHVDLSHHLRFLVDQKRMADFKKSIKNDKDSIKGGCLAGIAALYICSDGTVLSCPFVKYACGNIYQQKLFDIWENNKDLNLLRDRKKFKGKCGKCKYVNVCGGCRAKSLINTGKINGSEANCFYNND